MNDIEKAVESLNKKGFKAVYAKDKADAISYVLSEIGRDDTVGFGGSMTLFETGIADALLERGHKVYSSELAARTDGNKGRGQASWHDRGRLYDID